MGTLTKKTQILFSDEQFESLKRVAEERRTSVGALVREAVEEIYLKEIKEKRKRIAQHLINMSLPVDKWEKMEEEIIRGAQGEKR